MALNNHLHIQVTSAVRGIKFLIWLFTQDHTYTHTQLAAANPEIKASVTDVISGYICDRARKRAEQTDAE